MSRHKTNGEAKRPGAFKGALCCLSSRLLMQCRPACSSPHPSRKGGHEHLPDAVIQRQLKEKENSGAHPAAVPSYRHFTGATQTIAQQGAALVQTPGEPCRNVCKGRCLAAHECSCNVNTYLPP